MQIFKLPNIFSGIPYALYEAGFGLGLVLLVLVAYITDYSLILMVRCGHVSGRFSYQGIMEAAFGRPGYILLGILQFFYPFIGQYSPDLRSYKMLRATTSLIFLWQNENR